MRDFLKNKSSTAADAPAGPSGVADTVTALLDEIKRDGDAAISRLASRFDGCSGPSFTLTDADIAKCIEQVPASLRADISLSIRNVSAFARAQRASVEDFEMEVSKGFFAGQRTIALENAGCYVPGGRYAHIASAVMTVATARAAGCKHVAVCTPPRRRPSEGEK
jgi:sulfopropanediol 3-dehydrogenase